MNLRSYFFNLGSIERSAFIEKMKVVLGKTEITIRSYINENRKVQAKDARKISELTSGSVTLHDLCPNVFEKVA